VNTSDKIIKAYYKKRAPIYDRVYTYPERQQDLRFLEEYIENQFSQLNVLEVAAGTGYWTQFIATTAKIVLATDATLDTLKQINKRPFTKHVKTMLLDAFSLDELPQKFTGAFAGLWISHIPKQQLKQFLKGLQRCLQPGSTVVFIDNSLAQCQRLPISFTDEYNNTYQDRQLDDKSLHRVLKNFPAEKELMEATASFGSNHKYLQLENFWLFQYQSN
jgi:demethylmenaquinone methyltransferase/2-methoxy-6-polyprenyl-1,4-benzoquinol methylase